MRKLGVVYPDLVLGIASISTILMLIYGATKFNLMLRLTVMIVVLILFTVWYFKRYTFYDSVINIFRLSNMKSPHNTIPARSVQDITFHSHSTLTTGTLVHIHILHHDKKHLIAFTYTRKHRFVLIFAAINGIKVDTGGVNWIEQEYLDILQQKVKLA
jgi:hypothetical protein